MGKLCPGCKVSVQTTNFSTGIGTTDPAQIVSYLQRNPDTDYIVVGIGDATAGIPEALAAADLAGKVKIVTRLADTINFKDIQSGTETMGVTEETYEIGWRMVDALARRLPRRLDGLLHHPHRHGARHHQGRPAGQPVGAVLGPRLPAVLPQGLAACNDGN